jgi:hypothetical protein
LHVIHKREDRLNTRRILWGSVGTFGSRIHFETLEPRRLFSIAAGAGDVLWYPVDRPIEAPVAAIGFKWQAPVSPANPTDPSHLYTELAPPSKTVLFEKDGAAVWGPRGVGPTLEASIDWGDGSSGIQQITFSEGRVYFTQPHDYAEWGHYTVTISSPQMAEPMTLTANVSVGNGPFEVTEMPETITYADPYNAINAPLPLMRFRGEPDTDEPMGYFAELHIAGDSRAIEAKVVRVNGAAGLYDVEADVDFMREGDYDVAITISRGIDRQRALGGEMFFMDGRQTLATVHGMVHVNGAYVPAMPGDEPADVPPNRLNPRDDDGLPVPTPPGAHTGENIEYINWQGMAAPVVKGEWLISLDPDQASWMTPTPTSESQWGGDSINMNDRGLQAALDQIGGGLQFEQYVGNWNLFTVKVPTPMSYGQLRSLLSNLPGFTGQLEPNVVHFFDSQPIVPSVILTPVQDPHSQPPADPAQSPDGALPETTPRVTNTTAPTTTSLATLLNLPDESNILASGGDDPLV